MKNLYHYLLPFLIISLCLFSTNHASAQVKVCTGDTVMLTDSIPGGIWQSSDTNIAKVDSGIVLGIAAGIDTITYTSDTISVMWTVTVNPTPGPIIGDSIFCANCMSSLSLTDTTDGGMWSSSDTTQGIIDSVGVLIPGPDFTVPPGAFVDITYTLPTGCSTNKWIWISYFEKVPTVTDNSQIQIFPNPAITELNIISFKNIGSIVITNLLGQQVISLKPSTIEKQITADVSPLPPGIYFIKVNGSEARKFVKE